MEPSGWIQSHAPNDRSAGDEQRDPDFQHQTADYVGILSFTYLLLMARLNKRPRKIVFA